MSEQARQTEINCISAGISYNSVVVASGISSELSFSVIINQLDGNDTVESSYLESPRIPQPTSQSPINNNEARENVLPGDKRSIVSRISPVIPEPQWVGEADANGWCLIDQVGAWQSFL